MDTHISPPPSARQDSRVLQSAWTWKKASLAVFSQIEHTQNARGFCRDTVISAVDTRDYFLQEIDAIYKECIVTSDFSLVGVAAESASAPINEERNGAMGNRPSLLACALAAVSLILTAVSVTQGLLLAATVSGFLAGFQCGLILAVFLVKKVMAEGKGILN